MQMGHGETIKEVKILLTIRSRKVITRLTIKSGKVNILLNTRSGKSSDEKR